MVPNRTGIRVGNDACSHTWKVFVEKIAYCFHLNVWWIVESLVFVGAESSIVGGVVNSLEEWRPSYAEYSTGT